MSLVASPNGLMPMSKLASAPNNDALTSFLMTANNTSAIGIGDLVSFTSGSINPVTGIQTFGTPSSNTPVGVFQGVSYMDPVLGFVNRGFIPANLINTLAASGAPTPIIVTVKVLDDPNQLFKIQGTGYIGNSGSLPTLAQALATVGKNIEFKTGTLCTPNTITGQSVMSVDTSVIATAAKSLRIVGFATNPGSSPIDPFPDLIVRWNAGVHAYSVSGAA